MVLQRAKRDVAGQKTNSKPDIVNKSTDLELKATKPLVGKVRLVKT